MDKNGVKVYTVAAGKSNVRVTEDGAIISIETPILVADLPKAVADKVKAAAVANGATTASIGDLCCHSIDEPPVNGAKTDLATKAEWRADPKSLKALDKPAIVYEIRLVKGGTEGTMQVAEDGTVQAPLVLAAPMERR